MPDRVSMKQKTLLCILGPTAVGKTTTAIEVAKTLGTEIISADSRQFYKEISIGTAKPTARELNEVQHHFIGHISVGQDYSAGDFERDALEKLEQLFKHHDVVIAVGGSGLYVKALIEGLDDMPQANEQLRDELHLLYAQKGIEGLQLYLKQLDEARYEGAETQNPQRLMRAIEIASAVKSGFIPSRKKHERNFKVVKAVLNLPREILYDRINKRVDAMVEEGLLQEVKNVVALKDTYALQTVGYKEMFGYLEGAYSLETAIDLIKQHTRNYAKRQLTWFRKEAPAHWFVHADVNNIVSLLETE